MCLCGFLLFGHAAWRRVVLTLQWPPRASLWHYMPEQGAPRQLSKGPAVLMVWAVLSLEGCLTASSASTHGMPGTVSQV